METWYKKAIIRSVLLRVVKLDFSCNLFVNDYRPIINFLFRQHKTSRKLPYTCGGMDGEGGDDTG